LVELSTLIDIALNIYSNDKEFHAIQNYLKTTKNSGYSFNSEMDIHSTQRIYKRKLNM